MIFLREDHAPVGMTEWSSHSSNLLVFHHLVDQCVELTAVDYLDERLAGTVVADHVEGGSVLEFDGLAQFFVGVDEGGKFAIGIDDEGQIDFVLGGEFFGVAAQVFRRDFQLVVEYVLAEVIAQTFRVSVEITGEDGGLKRPTVEGKREVVEDERNFVSFGGLVDKRVSAAAIGTLQVLEDHDGDAGAFRRAQGGADGLLGRNRQRSGRQ